MAPEPVPAAPVSLGALTRLFLRVGATAFGGGVTSHLLEAFSRRGWISEAAYLEALNWCQNLPGPNATNLSAYLGWRFDGPRGAVLATIGLLLPGASFVLVLGAWIARGAAPAATHGALLAVAAAAVGFLLAVIGKLARQALNGPLRVIAAIATFALVAWVRLPAPLVLAAVVALLWRFEGPEA
jgi:chromate transporter